MTDIEWPARFAEILRGHLPLLDENESLDPATPLTDLGLDSLATVALLIDLEEAFAVAVPDDKLTAQTFATAKDLWSTLAESAG